MHVSGLVLQKQVALKYLNVETRLLFAPLINFLAMRLVATASIYQKILRFVFDFIYVWSCDFSGSTFYFGTDQS